MFRSVWSSVLLGVSMITVILYYYFVYNKLLSAFERKGDVDLNRRYFSNSKRGTAYRERSISERDPRPEVPEIN